MEISKLLITLIMVFGLAACGSNPIQRSDEAPEETLVVVAEDAPEPPKVERPKLAIEQLTEADRGDHPKVARAYVASVEQLIGFSEYLICVLEGYRADVEDPENVCNAPSSNE